MTDLELLKQYGEARSQQAFAELVGRHLEWVYGAAVRRVHDRELAEDVAQGVFIALSRRAKSLGGEQALSPWLLRVVRCAAINALRGQRRRQRHEQKAAAMRPESINADTESRWEEVAPLLDDQVLRLGKKDQKAILLRFYERKSLAEVGEAMGIGEEAARKRVERAVGKLGEMLGKKGISGTTAGLSAVLVGNVVGQMPEHLVEKIVSAAGSGGGSTVAAAIAKGALKMMTIAKVRVAAVVVAAVAVALPIGLAQLAGSDNRVAKSNGSTQGVRSASTQPRDLELDAGGWTREQTLVGVKLRTIALAAMRYANDHGQHSPPDPGSALAYIDKDTPPEKAKVFLTPRDEERIRVPDAPTAEWVNQNTSFVYLAQDVDLSQLSDTEQNQTVLMHTRLDDTFPHPKAGKVMVVVCVDGHSDIITPELAARAIAESKRVLEAARMPAAYSAK